MKKYMELYREMRQDIVEGRYGFSERLPSKRYLAEERGISLITVEHALKGILRGRNEAVTLFPTRRETFFLLPIRKRKPVLSIFSRGKLLFPGSKCPIPPLPKRCGEP